MFAFQENEDQVCPHCRNHAYVRGYRAILITTEAWPTGLMILSAALLITKILGLDLPAAIFFAILAILPLFLALIRKSCCLRCGLEFRTTTPEIEQP